MIHPEQMLISTLFNLGRVLSAEELGITIHHFHEFKAEYEWLISYKLKYKQEPTLSAFLSAFEDFRVSEHIDLDYSIEEVRKSHLAHLLSKAFRQGVSDLKSGRPDDSYSGLEEALRKIRLGVTTSQPMSNSLVNYSASLDYALDRANGSKITGIPFAHPTLHMKTYGQEGGDLTVFAARVNQGKSWELVYEACNALMLGKKVVYWSLEMSKRAMEYRFQTILGTILGFKIPNSALSKGRGLDLLEYKDMLSAISERVPGELLINDQTRGKVTPTTIASSLDQHCPDLAVADYITLLGSSAGARASDGWQTVAAITGELKEVATNFDIPILTAAQINREGDTSGWRPPKTRNLAQSDTIGQDADNVVTMKRFGKGAMVHSMEKNRSGEAGFLWWSKFDPEHGDFSEVTREQAEVIKAEGEYDDYDG